MTQLDDAELTKAMCVTVSKSVRTHIAQVAETGDWGRALYLEGVLQGLQIARSYLTSEADFIHEVEQALPRTAGRKAP